MNDSRNSPRRSPERVDIELDYIRRDVDSLGHRMMAVENKLRQNILDKMMNLVVRVDWRTWAVWAFLILGLLGHLSIEEVRTYAGLVK